MNAPESHFSGRRFPALATLRPPARAGFSLLLLVWLVAGCASSGLKGTPFYTGDYAKRQGPAENRVNVWPLFYYRDPALSVLWPVFELTEDHAAVRPLFSVYDLDQPKHEYNVLWPLVQIDQNAGAGRIFPWFWGRDGYALFPLYWHQGEPFGAAGGCDTLFPLWMLNRKSTNYFNLYSPWPLARVWSNQESNTHGSMVFPLYWQQRDSTAERFYSLPWWSERKSEVDYWRLLVPVFYQAQSGAHHAFVSPLWSQGHSERGDWRAMFPLWTYAADADRGSFDCSAPWPLVRWWSDPMARTQGSHVLPLYWAEQSGAAQRFYSLPWSSGTGPGEFWRALVPCYYEASNAHATKLLTPVWSRGQRAAGGWEFLLPLWWRTWENPHYQSVYFLPGRVWVDTRQEETGSTIVPFYWRRQREGRSQFYSALWMSDTDRTGHAWRLLPPLFYQETTPTSHKLITPLWAQGQSPTNDWGAIIPLCYWDRQQHQWYSPLWAHWQRGTAETWLLPWTLSWRTKTPERNDLALLGNVAHFSWGTVPGPDHVLPLYYHNPKTGTQLSPLWLRWREPETETTVVPGLLSWQTRHPDRTDLYFGGGLARASWGRQPVADYVLPLFWRDEATLFTPLFGWDNTAHFNYFATPLVGSFTGPRHGAWAWPLFSYVGEAARGTARGEFLLLGRYDRTPRETRSWFFPLYHYRHRPESELAFVTNRIRTTAGSRFWCLPMCWYRNESQLRTPRRQAVVTNAMELEPGPVTGSDSSPLPVRDYTTSHGVFPLWSAQTQSTPSEGRSHQEHTLLLRLYDYQHQVGPLPGAAAARTNDYTRARVLWRLWHYEKLNHAVSVDIFPAFTYDRRPDGFKKVSFLWRCYRYEQDGVGRKKLDLLFIPLRR